MSDRLALTLSCETCERPLWRRRGGPAEISPGAQAARELAEAIDAHDCPGRPAARKS